MGKNFPNLNHRARNMTAHIIENDVEDINQAVAIDRNAFDEGPLPKKCLCIHFLPQYSLMLLYNYLDKCIPNSSLFVIVGKIKDIVVQC